MSINDKLKDLTPIEVTFAEGERPTNEKLEGMMGQVADGLEFIENSFGDAYGHNLQTANIWMSNLTRDIGDRSLLNPILRSNVFIDNYVQELTLGKNEHELDLIPVGSGAAIVSSSADSSVVPAQFKSAIDELEVPGDWTLAPGLSEGGIVKNARKLVTHSPSSGHTIVFSQVTSGRGSSFVSGQHNTIPSIAQAMAGGDLLDVTLSDAENNIYTIVLPVENTVLDRVYEEANATLSNTKASVGAGQQMELPSYLFDPSGLDMLSNDPTSGQGKEYPLNMIRIYDWQEKKLVDGLTSVKASSAPGNRKFEIICTFRDDVVLDDTSGQYILVTSGVSLSDAVGALQRDVYFHTHNGDDMIRHIDHSALMGLRTGDDTLDRSRYYGASNIDNNDHSMYFHRDGFTDSDIGGGANIIRGDMLIGSIETGLTAEHENYNLTSDSHKLYFGHTEHSGHIFFDKIRNQVIPEGRGNIPQTFNDNALVIEGSRDDTTQLLSTVFINSNLRVANDVVLGTSADHDVVVSGDIYVNKALTFTPEDNPLSSRATLEAGMIDYNNLLGAHEFYDGTNIKTFAAVEDQLGDVKSSMLDEATFQTQRDTTWVLIDGRDITGSDLHALTGITILPDSRDKFARGNRVGRTIGSEEIDSTRLPHNNFTTTSDTHTHTTGDSGDHTHSVSSSGSHTHTGGDHHHLQGYDYQWTGRYGGTNAGSATGRSEQGSIFSSTTAANTSTTGHSHSGGNHTHTTNDSGIHTHNVLGDGSHFHTVDGGGDSETRPVNFSVNYYIKINKRP